MCILTKCLLPWETILCSSTLSSFPSHTALPTLWQSGTDQCELLFNEHLPSPEGHCHKHGDLSFSHLLMYLKCQQECLTHSRCTFNICWMDASFYVIMRALKCARNSISIHKCTHLLTKPTLVFPSPTGRGGSTFLLWWSHFTHQSKPCLPIRLWPALSEDTSYIFLPHTLLIVKYSNAFRKKKFLMTRNFSSSPKARVGGSKYHHILANVLEHSKENATELPEYALFTRVSCRCPDLQHSTIHNPFSLQIL